MFADLCKQSRNILVLVAENEEGASLWLGVSDIYKVPQECVRMHTALSRESSKPV